MMACTLGLEELAHLLLIAGADCMAADHRGRSCLGLARRAGGAVAELLARHCAGRSAASQTHKGSVAAW